MNAALNAAAASAAALAPVSARSASADDPRRWRLPHGLQDVPAVAYRNRLARTLATKPVPEMLASYVYLTRAQMEEMVALAQRHVLRAPLRGVGVELGAGCGLLSAVVAQDPAVEAIWAVDVCEEMVRSVMPRVASWMLGDRAVAVRPVVGSFDDLGVPDASLDFAIEIDSLHHSDDLIKTLAETARVLRRGGQVLCFDRVHPDTVTDADVDRLLSQVYSRAFLAANAYPLDLTLTRRENGEHEYRLFEWRRAFDAAGFELTAMTRWRQRIPAKRAVKGLLSLLPAGVRRRLYASDNASLDAVRHWIAQQPARCRAALGGGTASFAPKDTTVFVLRKP